MATTTEKRLFDRFGAAQTLIHDHLNNRGNGSDFIAKWFQRHGEKLITEKVDLAAVGLEVEGKNLGNFEIGSQLANELRKVKDESFNVIITCCIRLYTLETFLYRSINNALRNNDISKIDTLGPFCWFLHNMPYCTMLTNKCFKERIYRGGTLDISTIDEYRRAIGMIKAWNGFSSASKNRSVAEVFGANVVFIIDTNPGSRPGHSIDISSYSYYPEEEEVLIRAGRNFSIDKVVEPFDGCERYLIYLTIV